MKALFIILLSAITYTAVAQDAQLVGFKLRSGRKISFADEIRKLETNESKVEQVELESGEVYYDFEIDHAVIKAPNGRTHNINLNNIRFNNGSDRFDRTNQGRVLAVGGDGSGGG